MLSQVIENNSALLKKLRSEEKDEERERGARRYLPALKTIKALASNEIIEPPLPIVHQIHCAIYEFLLACPVLQKNRSNFYEHQYVVISVEILKGMLKNKDYFYDFVLGKNGDVFEDKIFAVFEQVIRYESLMMNEFCL